MARLVELLAERHGTSTQVPAVAPFELISAADRELLPAGVVDAYPLSRVQAGMVVEMLADRQRNAYHVVTSFRLRDGRAFSLPALRAAAGIAADRHELLRTSLHLTGYSEPMQLVHGDVEIPINVRDLRGLSPAEREREVRDYTAREQNDPFDVAVAPLMRLTVHVETDETWWLTVAVCHPVTEGWSHRAMLVEMLDDYARSRDGEPLRPYEHPPVRYADFIAAEQRAIASTADREHWRSVVDNHDPMRLPAGWGDEEGTGSFSVTVPWGDLERELRALASTTQASLKAVLHAAHLTVLSRLTEAERFHTGLVFSARPEAPGADRVYGMYLNILPFGFDRTARTWSELIRAVYEQEAAAWPHRRFPMPVIQRELAGGERLYDVRFSYQEDFEEVDTDLIDVENGLGDGASEFPLAVAAVGGGLILTMERRAISRVNADRLASMYRAVLESMAADADGDARAAFLPDGELRRLLMDYNRTSPAPVTRTVLDMFEAQAAATPDATAVNAADRRVTYAELDALANRYAHHLRANGVRREAGAQPVVGLLLDRSADLVAALLGVWKAGAAYVPLDPSHPADRLRHMLDNAGAALVVTQSRHADEIAGAFDGPVVRVDTAAAEIAARPATPVEGGSDLDELAYVIYTSGSTGRPKGVQVPHRGLANHIQWAAAELAGRGTSGAPLFSSIAFDLPVPNLYGPLVTGQTVHLFPASSDLDDLGEWLARTGPFSFIKLTPGHLDVLSHQLSPAQASGLAPVIVVAGEAFTRRTLERWRALDSTAELINEYGPTEASVGTCIQPVSSAPPADIVPIGRPLPGMTMYVLDHLMRPVPVGVPGELYVGGTGVARGYANRPDLTAERFLPNPFTKDAGTRLYRTGDLVRMLPGGAVDFLGRLDDQVKVRGYRIELGEVKTVLVAHPAVRDAVVVTRDTGNGEIQLVAYCVPAGDGGELSVAALTEHSRARLPEYMLPTAYVPIEQIPLTANGKVDRRALPDPTEAASTGPEFIGPSTPTETAIAEIWCTVLGLERVGVHDRFFALGGHSILMIQVLAAARKAGLDLTVAHMYQHETIAELAAVLDEMSLDPPAAQPAQAPPAAEPDDERTGPTMLTPIQRRFLTLPGNANRYVQAALLEVRPAADPELLGAALRALTDHHDSLRLRVNGDDASIADTTSALRVVDLSGQSTEEREAAVRRIVDEAADGHDIAAGRMMLATLLPGATDDGDRLLLSVHHLAVDIVSWSILVADLNDAYAALEAGRPVELPPPTTSFRRWASRLAAHVADGGLAAQVPFWLNRMPALQLPVDHPDGADTSADTHTVTVTLPRHLTAALTHDLPAGGQARPDEVVYTALAMAVTAWAGGNRAAFDIEGHGREPLFDDVDTSRTVGWFTSLYPVSLWLPTRGEPDAVLRSVRDQLRAIPDRGIGYGMLRYLSPDPDLTAALDELPPPQILVNYTGHRAVGTPSGKGPDGGRPAGPRFSLPPQQLVSRHEPDRPRSHPIQITAGVHDHQLFMHWTYSGQRYEEATVRAVAEATIAAVTTLVESAGPPAGGAAPLALRPSMDKYHVPGASVAVMRDGELVSTEAHGTLRADGGDPVTPETIFQVGSVSKHVTAYGVLRLAAAGRLDIDTDVNEYLTSWRLEHAEGVTGDVTLRHLLSHVAGLTVVRNSGYQPGEAAPTLLDLLRGSPTAGTPQLSVELAPGTTFRKSNGHYWVVEQVLRDLTGQPFNELMRELVFDPIGMPATSFDQDFPATAGVPVAVGHDEDGNPVPGGWRVKPVLASTGLWASAPDLARLLAEVRRAYLGESSLLPCERAAELLTAVHADALYGLGTSVDDTGTEVEYGHVGESVGYRAMLLGRVHSGAGFVVLTNADSGKEVHKAVGLAIGRQEGRQFGVRQGQTELGY
ncbi:non-ribosomal peptide synthetase [Micromonospora sp. DR5-3]|uniref:non-ribosomal peptide synthetase n=1 Tax=unclassified Micromonospora TaxID=2617518 RepID=UPI001CA37559|nr:MULTISPECIES: non-ribosomal peptide synthetase [unclassified Micromonospora]MCW3817563.1 non-ribosomal peptide synthetase [Micromonospora sp. DR5-3]